MSAYLSYRRRYSEPEKPEPRFQWRLRVHSLMMSDSDPASSLASERRSQRYDSLRDQNSASSYGAVSRDEKQVADSLEGTDSRQLHRHRRDRFTRTKSEGHLKLRVRFSKFSDESKSLDDSESEMYSGAENRRLKSSQESGIDSSREHPSDEEEYATEKFQEYINPQSKGSGDEDYGFAGEEFSGSSPQDEVIIASEDVYDNEINEGIEKDVSKGAIPKKFLRENTSKLDPQKQETDDDLEHCYSLESALDVRSTDFTAAAGNLDTVSRTHEMTENSTGFTSDTKTTASSAFSSSASDSPSQFYHRLDDRSDCNLANEENGNEEGIHGAHGERQSQENDRVDDIESLIEQIIAEEEAILNGKERSQRSMKVSSENLNEEDINTVKAEDKDQKDSDVKGINITRSCMDKKRSSSLPSCQHSDDHTQSKTIAQFSSSCPLSKNDISQEKKAEEDCEEEEDGWAYLPVIFLEDVFTLLSPKERHQASQVCRQWYDLFYSPRVWETFILLERTLTKKRFNLYKGYQREICPGKTQLCFRRVGSFFKRIVVTPITDYFNLYEFLRILAAFLQYQEEHGLAAMPLLHTFDFTFACASRGDGEVIVHGTGGQILEMIKQLLIRISNLKHLKLNQLLIDELDVPGLFDAMVNCFSECLSSLEMLNVTKVPFGLTDLARFRNLGKLTVSPQHLNEEVLLLLGGLNLLQLHILQDPYTCECEPVAQEAWKLVREMAPCLRVYLEVSGNTRAQILIQPKAPVSGVFLRTPYSRLTNDLVMAIVEYYSKTLRYFVQERLPRVHGPRGIDSRCDSSLLFMARRCPALHTLVIRERISTSTLILLANEGKSLSTLLVRKHALIKRCDWPRRGEWTKEFYSRLKRCSLDYDQCTDEVCTLLRRRWRPLTDKQFMRLKIAPRAEIY